MKSRDLDRLARGPNPLERVSPPNKGERCPRCHSGFRNKPCLLCMPHLVPVEYRSASKEQS